MPALATESARPSGRNRPGSEMAYAQSVLRLVTSGLEERLAALVMAGGDPSEVLGEAAEIAERMLAAVPTPHAWDAQIGPFYDTPGVSRLLGISKQAVADRVRRRTILSGVTRQGRVVYPVFQFRGRHLVSEISDVAARFRGVEVDDWAVSAWFTTPAADLDGKTPARWLTDGGPAGPVHELAEQTARRWA